MPKRRLNQAISERDNLCRYDWEPITEARKGVDYDQYPATPTDYVERAAGRPYNKSNMRIHLGCLDALDGPGTRTRMEARILAGTATAR